MSTHACIAVKHDEKITAIYCHFDGGLNYVGEVLHKYYRRYKANFLMASGDLSSLGADVEPPDGMPHSWDSPAPNVCVFYGRDRGEKGVDADIVKDEQELLSRFSHCSYFYLMVGTTWFVSTGDEFELLSTKLAIGKEEV